MGLDDEEMAFEEPRSALPERQRTAFAIMIEGLGGDRAIDVYNACGPVLTYAAWRRLSAGFVGVLRPLRSA